MLICKVCIGSTKLMSLFKAPDIGYIEETKRASFFVHSLTYAGRGVQQHIPHSHSDTFPGEVLLYAKSSFF